MKRYKVVAVMTTRLVAYVEADNIEDACDIADGLDGGVFEEIPYSGDWFIDDVMEEEK